MSLLSAGAQADNGGSGITAPASVHLAKLDSGVDDNLCNREEKTKKGKWLSLNRAHLGLKVTA